MAVDLLSDMAHLWPELYNTTSFSRFRAVDTLDITVLYQLYCQVCAETKPHEAIKYHQGSLCCAAAQVKHRCIIDDQRVTDDAAKLLMLGKDE